MDQFTQTSLEALLLRATNANNYNLDSAAVEAFCTLINKEREGPSIGVKVIAAKLPNGSEKEVLLTLNLLDTCMNKCGSSFQNEVGKFRFLNEMIKLVSPKYLGSRTPLLVKQKVLQLLYLWTLDHPKEIKIKEAFEMLRKQGVLKDIPNPNIPLEALNSESRRRPSTSIRKFLNSPDQERSNILQKLLQSKDPEDIQLANWLIKSMVKEDEKLQDVKSRTISDLESVKNTLRLLNEMLDSYKQESTTSGELDLMRELYDNCVKFRTNLSTLAWHGESSLASDLFVNVLMANDDLTEAINKYTAIIIQGKTSHTVPTFQESNYSLLQFDQHPPALSSCDIPKVTNFGLKLDDQKGACSSTDSILISKSPIDELCDIFTTSGSMASTTSEPVCGILQPVAVCSKDVLCTDETNRDKENKTKAFEDLDVLDEHLKENLLSSNHRCQEKTPMNQLGKISDNNMHQTVASSLAIVPPLLSSEKVSESDLTFLLQNTPEKVLPKTLANDEDTTDDCLVDISEDRQDQRELSFPSIESKKESIVDNIVNPCISKNDRIIDRESKKCDNSCKLIDISIKLEDIKPSHIKPLVVLEDKSGITMTIHPAKEKVKPSVYVYVVTTINKNELPLTNYLFQAVVPKSCKLRLLPPSTTDLPACNPFLPPSAITQIMLVANPERVQISLKCILSYVMDEDTFTEMGDIEQLPLAE